MKFVEGWCKDQRRQRVIQALAQCCQTAGIKRSSHLHIQHVHRDDLCLHNPDWQTDADVPHGTTVPMSYRCVEKTSLDECHEESPESDFTQNHESKTKNDALHIYIKKINLGILHRETFMFIKIIRKILAMQSGFVLFSKYILYDEISSRHTSQDSPTDWMSMNIWHGFDKWWGLLSALMSLKRIKQIISSFCPWLKTSVNSEYLNKKHLSYLWFPKHECQNIHHSFKINKKTTGQTSKEKQHWEQRQCLLIKTASSFYKKMIVVIYKMYTRSPDSIKVQTRV